MIILSIHNCGRNYTDSREAVMLGMLNLGTEGENFLMVKALLAKISVTRGNRVLRKKQDLVKVVFGILEKGL